jgi:GT2 family glycosyltransferase
MTRVDLIVSTHNNLPLLAACLDSLRASRFQDFRLIVFDDNSDPPATPLVRDKWPSASIVTAKRNVGLIRGLNRAIDLGTSEFVVLLNDDTEVEPDWLGNLVASANRNPAAGSVASKLRLHSDHQKLHSAGDGFSTWGMPYNRGVWLDDLGQYDTEEEVFSACGGAALYRRSALEAVRLVNGDILDSSLFMYCEDVDIGWRLQLAGYRCVFRPDAVVYHHLSATGGGTLASYYVARNSLLLLRRTVPSRFVRENPRRIVAHQAGRLFTAARHVREPAARATLRGILRGLLLAAVSAEERQECDAAEYARIMRLIAR